MTTDEAGQTYKYDAWNRFVEVNQGSTTLASYAHDALGRRVKETHGSTTTDLYYSDEWQVVQERVGLAKKAEYYWSPLYVDAMILRDRDADNNSSTGYGGLEERLYAQQDANYNVTALIETDGDVAERFV